VLYVKFNTGEHPVKDDYVPFAEMKRRVQQDLYNLHIDINDDNYRKMDNFIKLKDILIMDTENRFIYSEAWFVEKYIVGQERYEKIYGCYEMGVERSLNELELNLDQMCRALTIYSVECCEMDQKDIYRNITRNGKKTGLIQRLKEQLDFDINDFDDDQEKLKLLYLCYRFERRFGNKTLTAFLKKPSLENVDNSYTEIQNVNGEMMAFLKRSLEREVAVKFVVVAKEMVDKVARGWEKQIIDLRQQLDYDLFTDNKQEIERAYKMVGGYEQFYNKKTYLHGRYKHSLLETFYLKLLEHENIGREYDVIAVSNSVLDVDFVENDTVEFYDRLAAIEINISEVDTYLKEHRLEMVSYVFSKEKTTSNEKDRYDRVAPKVKYFIKMLIDNTKYKGIEVVSILLIVSCIREILSLKDADKIENRYYRAGMSAVKSIKSELYDDTHETIKAMSQLIWVERVLRRYNFCRHSKDVIQMARQTEKYMDHLIVRTLQTNSLEDMRVIHSHFMLEVQGMIYPQIRLIKDVKHFEKILRRNAYKYKIQVPGQDSWSPARQFFSLPIDDNILVELAKGLKQAMIGAQKDGKPKFYDYELTVEKAYFDEPLVLYFEFVIVPKYHQISIQRTELRPYVRMKKILEDNSIFV
jgi:hypothetical protein